MKILRLVQGTMTATLPRLWTNLHALQEKSHFESVCQSMPERRTSSRPEVQELSLDEETDEELLTLDMPNSNRWYVCLQINQYFFAEQWRHRQSAARGHSPYSGPEAGCPPHVQNGQDWTELQTIGVITLTIEHP